MHILDNQVGRAEVDEAPAFIMVRQQMAKEFDHLILPVVEVNQVLILPNYFKPFIKLHSTVLIRHVLLEISEAARCDVYHFFLAHFLILRLGTIFCIVAHSRALFLKRWQAIGFVRFVSILIRLIRSLWHGL